MLDERALEERVLGMIAERFPVTQSPYCDLGVALGAQEIDVLNAVLAVRSDGRVSQIVADFGPANSGVCSIMEGSTPGTLGGVRLTCEQAELAMLLRVDMPWGEHPFAELALELQERGYDVDEPWVLEAIRAWLASGIVRNVAAELR